MPVILAGPGVTANRLEVLCKRELRELCAKFGCHISTRANVSDIVATLLATDLSLDDMSAEQLIRICREEKVAIGTGYKADVIERLVNATNRVRPANQSEEAGSKAGPDDDDNYDDWKALDEMSKQELLDLCTDIGLRIQPKTSIPNIITEYYRYSYQGLDNKTLREMCEEMQVSKGGNKDALIDRLATALADQHMESHVSKEKQKAAVKEVDKELENGKQAGFMSKALYRKLLRSHNLLMSDQDVFHIIASEHGGADHINNYHFAQNAALNRAIGCRHDYLNAYLAGPLKSAAAVEVSKQHGNLKGMKYAGPSAEELYKKGADAMRDLRENNRGWYGKAYRRN